MTPHHTPGPWAWDGKFTVTIPHAQGDASFRTNPEDARLIAAAPDLLTAIEESFEYLDETLGWASCQDDPDCGCILHDLHAAVEKARGRL